MNIIDLNQRTPAWHAWRSQGVTASEAPVIMGASPYQTPWRLWAVKTGKVRPEDLSHNPNVRRGIALEDEARADFEARHGAIVIPICAQSSEHPQIRASFDGLDDEGRPVEIKVPSAKKFEEVMARGIDDDPWTFEDVTARGTDSDAYRMYWWQVQVQLLVADAQSGFLVFYQGPGVFREFTVFRNDAAIAEIVASLTGFWRLIQDGEEPPLDPARDLYIPTGESLDDWTAKAGKYRKLAADKAKLDAQVKKLKGDLDGIEDDLVAMMGDFLLAETAGLKVTRFAKRGSVDYKAALAVLHPDLEEAALEAYRRSPSEEVRVTVQKEATAAVPFDASQVEAARVAAADKESCFF